MNDHALEAHLAKTLEAIRTLPAEQQAQMLKLVDETRLRHNHVAEATARSLDALDDWRVLQKYRVFDAEARQREALQGLD